MLLSASLPGPGMSAAPFSGPYREIPAQNAFRLKPPAAIEAPPVGRVLLPQVKMTGLTTIFGDKRVLLKILFPARPPDAAQEVSCILLQGQSFGLVEVLEIDMPAERIKISNAGEICWLGFERETAAVMARSR